MGPSAPDSPVELAVARDEIGRLAERGGAERAGALSAGVVVRTSVVASYVPAPAGRYVLAEAVAVLATSAEVVRDERVDGLRAAL